jgi:hypothetical protein
MENSLDITSYIKNNYGFCKNNICHCRSLLWIGKMCQNWKSCECSTYDELAIWQKGIKSGNI